MVPTQSLENFPIFGDNATKVKPDDAKYAAGFQQADVYPAEWVNYVWNKSSSGVTKLNEGVNMMEQEINNVLAGADKTPDATENNQLLESIQKLITDAEARAKLAAHPVGSLYWSKNSTDPATLFGGTWARVKDKFILAAGDTYAQGATGGAATVTLDTTQIPGHSHSFTPAGSVSSHTHSFTPSGTVGSHSHSVGAHSHGLNSHTHSVGAHSHGLNSHTHSVGAHSHGLNSHTHGVGTIATGSGGSHTHRLLVYTASTRLGIEYRYPPMSNSTNSGPYAQLLTGSADNPFDVADSSPTTFQSGTNASGYARYGNWGARANVNYKRTLVESDGSHTHTMSGSTGAASGSTADSTAFNSGAASGNTANSTAFNTGGATGNTANSTAFDSGSTQPSFTGSAGTTGGTQPTFTGSAGTTGSTGGGQAHNNMPPYIVYYCWERTA